MSVDLRLGDCRQITPTLAGIDAVVSDVPYGLNYSAEVSTQQQIQKFAPIVGDDRPFDASSLLDFPDVLIWCRPQLTVNLPVGVGAWYAWDKVTKNGLNVRIAELEFAWHKRATKTRAFRHLWSGAYRASESGRKSLHPTQKPVALMRWCIERLKLNPGSTILDPYMGSGSTGVAAVELGYNFVGIECHEPYFKVARARLAAALDATPLLTGVPDR